MKDNILYLCQIKVFIVKFIGWAPQKLNANLNYYYLFANISYSIYLEDLFYKFKIKFSPFKLFEV